MSEKMIWYTKQMKKLCKDYTQDCRFKLDVITCQEQHKVNCPVVDHR